MTSARDKIFNKLEKFKTNTPLEINYFKSNYEDTVKEFIDNAKLAGAKIYSTKDQIELFLTNPPKDSFRWESTLGVAENGALWCSDFSKHNRAKPFSCRELIITIKKDNLVNNMHEAYKKIDLSKKLFGTFISGPSKTADIEQSLVIGAHGAMGLHILLED